MQQNEADRDAMYDNIGEESMASLGDSEEFVEDDADGYEGAELRRYQRGSTASGTNGFTSNYSPPPKKPSYGDGYFGPHGPGGHSTKRGKHDQDFVGPPQSYYDKMDDLIENPHGQDTDDSIPEVTRGEAGSEIAEAYATKPQAIPVPGSYDEEDDSGISRGQMWEMIDAANGSAEDFTRRIKKLKSPSMRSGTPKRYQRDPIAAAAASAGIDSKERMWAAVVTAQQHSDTVGGQRDVYREIASVMTPTPRRIRRQRVPVGPPPMSREQMWQAVRAATASGGDKATQTQAYRELVS
jgi:hypothetical protein